MEVSGLIFQLKEPVALTGTDCNMQMQIIIYKSSQAKGKFAYNWSTK